MYADILSISTKTPTPRAGAHIGQNTISQEASIKPDTLKINSRSAV